MYASLSVSENVFDKSIGPQTVPRPKLIFRDKYLFCIKNSGSIPYLYPETL